MEPYLTRQNKNRILKGIVTAFEDEGYSASRVASCYLGLGSFSP